MLSRRIATFLVGSWVGCGVLMAALVLQNLRWSRDLMSDASDPAKVLLIKVGEEDAALLLSYSAAEHSRTFTGGWEWAQMLLGGVLVATLAISPQRRALPLSLAAGMLLLTVIQHFAFTPEIVFRGRQADFLPDESAFSTRSRLTSLTQIYIGAEGLKLLIGGVLASYLFVANSGKKVRRKSRVSSIESSEPL